MESQDLGKASQPAYRAGSPPYKQALRTREEKMSTLSLVVVFIAFTFNAIYALVVQIPKEDGQKLERPWQFLLLGKVLYLG